MSEFSILIRKAALSEKRIERGALFTVMNCNSPCHEDKNFLTFGPRFTHETVDKTIKGLIKMGLDYWDDFFEVQIDYPEWYKSPAKMPISDLVQNRC